MSQKTQEIIEKEKITQAKNLDNVFNPSDFGVIYSDEVKEEDLLDEKKKKHENDIYNEVIQGLQADMEGLGMSITYSSKILIGEVAMNILLMNRIKHQIICKDLLRDKKVLKPTYLSQKRDSADPYKHSKSISYEVLHIHRNEEINPIFDKLIPKLQKQINEGLKQLGLLPIQQIERQKLTIIKKLRQRYEQIDKEYTIKAEKEVLSNKKGNGNNLRLVQEKQN